MKAKLLKLGGFVGLILPVSALAVNPPTLPPGAITSYGSVSNFLGTIMNWIFGILILLAVIFVLIAAFKYLTASGDPEKVKSASNTLIYAAIAVAVALLARGIPTLVGSFIGTSVTVP